MVLCSKYYSGDIQIQWAGEQQVISVALGQDRPSRSLIVITEVTATRQIPGYDPDQGSLNKQFFRTCQYNMYTEKTGKETKFHVGSLSYSPKLTVNS